MLILQMYAVEFINNSSDSINIDNVYITDGKEPVMTVKEHTVTYSDDKGTYNLYCKLYRPTDVEECGVVIFSHGFNGGCDDFQPDCEYLAKNGFASFTFEFCGGSNRKMSKGRETTEMTIYTEKADLLAVFDYVSKLDGIDTDNIFLAGGSQGGLISAMAAEELTDKVKAMALYFPAYNIPDNWRSNFRNESDIPATYELWGFKLGKVFFTSMRNYYPFRDNNIGKYKGNVLIMQGDSDNIVPLATAQEAIKHYDSAELVVYEGEGHGFSPATSQTAREKLLEFITKE